MTLKLLIDLTVRAPENGLLSELGSSGLETVAYSSSNPYNGRPSARLTAGGGSLPHRVNLTYLSMKNELPVAANASMAVLLLMPYLAQVVERASREVNVLNSSQVALLSMVSDTPLRGSEIAKRLGISRAAVTEAARRLEADR